LDQMGYSIHFHVFLPQDVLSLLHWFSENVRSLEVVEGPWKSPGSDEFHLLARIGLGNDERAKPMPESPNSDLMAKE